MFTGAPWKPPRASPLVQWTHGALDKIYGSIVHSIAPKSRLVEQFYSHGWGDLTGVLDAEEAWWEGEPGAGRSIAALHQKVLDVSPQPVRANWKTLDAGPRMTEMQATFKTSATGMLYDWLPEESRTAEARLWLPTGRGAPVSACAVLLAGTGDHGYARRKALGQILVDRGMAVLALESPFYGSRKPSGQKGSKLRHVCDLLALGKATILETRDLLALLRQEMGFSKMAVCGLSMGGVHACMVAGLSEEPLACIPMLSPYSASVPYVEPGMLGRACAWDNLREGDATHEEVKRKLDRVLRVTDVTLYPRPARPGATVVVGGVGDRYVPPRAVEPLHAWAGPESEIRWIQAGHVSAHVFFHKQLAQAVEDATGRLSLG